MKLFRFVTAALGMLSAAVLFWLVVLWWPLLLVIFACALDRFCVG